MITTSSSRDLPLGWGAALFTLTLALLWAGTSVTAREAVDRIPPLAVGGIRFGLAAVFMLGWCWWEGAPLGLRRGQWRPAVVMGLLLFVQIATFNIGVAWSNASHATLLINTYIFWVAGVEHYLTRTLRLVPLQGLGLVVSAAGASLLLLDAPAAGPSAGMVESTAGAGAGAAEEQGRGVLPQQPLDRATLAGDLMLLLSGGVLALKVIYTKHAVRHVAPGTLIFWHDLIGTLLFFVATALLEPWPEDPWTPRIVFSLLYAGFVVSGFCFAAHAWLLKRHSASQISVFSFATPVFGVFLAVVFRGDELSGWLLVAGALVAVGILLVNAGQTRGDESTEIVEPSMDGGAA